MIDLYDPFPPLLRTFSLEPRLAAGEHTLIIEYQGANRESPGRKSALILSGFKSSAAGLEDPIEERKRHERQNEFRGKASSTWAHPIGAGRPAPDHAGAAPRRGSGR